MKEKNGEHPYGDSGQLILLVLFLLIWLLEDRFQKAYRDYKKKTGKWVPMIGRRR